MANNNVSIWDKVNYDLVESSNAEAGTAEGPTADEQAADRAKWKRRRVVLDIVATAFWAFLLLKVFVTDIDREAVKAVAPHTTWLVDYRFFFFLAVFMVVVVFLPTRKVVLATAYVVCFPLVVAFWKIPKLIYKANSWVAFFGAINVASSIVTNLRFSVVAVGLGLFAILGVVAGSATPVLVVSAAVIAALFVVSLVRTIRLSLTPSRFLRMQERAIDRVINSEGAETMLMLNDDLRRDEIERFDLTQQNQFLANLSHSVITNRVLYFWAYQLDRYRKSAAPALFAAGGYLLLVFQAIGSLALVNFAVYKIDHHAFSFSTPPSLLVFIRYSFASLYGNDINAVHANCNAADWIAVASLVIGILIIGGAGLTWVLGSRQKAQDEAIRKTISQIKGQGRILEDRLRSEYGVDDVDQAVERLQELKAGLLGVITFFSSRIPSDFETG